MRLLAEELKLAEPAVPWHTSRVRVAELGGALAVTAGVLAKIGLDVALLEQTEIAEVREPAGKGGSSTMPHKRNPIGSALAIACARRVDACAVGAHRGRSCRSTSARSGPGTRSGRRSPTLWRSRAGPPAHARGAGRARGRRGADAREHRRADGGRAGVVRARAAGRPCAGARARRRGGAQRLVPRRPARRGAVGGGARARTRSRNVRSARRTPSSTARSRSTRRRRDRFDP